MQVATLSAGHRRPLGLLVCLAAVLWASTALASPTQPVSESQKTRKRPGTHFLIEVQNGVAIPGDPVFGDLGYSLRATFGAGGKIPGLPPRLYALAGVRSAFAEGAGVVDFQRTTLESSLVGGDFGVRLLVPIAGSFRLYADLLAVYLRRDTDLTVNAVEHYAVRDATWAMALGLGGQLRFVRWLSVGLHWDLLFERPPEDTLFVRNLMGLDGRNAWSTSHTVSLGVTVHF